MRLRVRLPIRRASMGMRIVQWMGLLVACTVFGVWVAFWVAAITLIPAAITLTCWEVLF